MPNIASVLKAEIARVARKEARAETAALKKHSVTQRTEIASLKKRVAELEGGLRRLGKEQRKSIQPPVAPAQAEGSGKASRFSLQLGGWKRAPAPVSHGVDRRIEVARKEVSRSTPRATARKPCRRSSARLTVSTGPR